jgi:tetratricopeptide (TPR) repeat protein
MLVVLALGVVAGVAYFARRATSNVPNNAPSRENIRVDRPGVTALPGDPSQEASTAQAPPGKIDAILNAVLPLRNQQEWGKAEAILREGMREYPGEQALVVQLAELFALQSRSEESYAMYERALAMGPSDGDIELNAGTVANAIGRHDRAEEHYSAAQAAKKTDWQPSLFLAQVQMRRGALSEAKKNLLLATQIKPDLAVAWGSLAEAMLRENSVGPALQMIAKARELEPHNVVWRLIEARALKRDNRPEAALQLLIGLDEVAKLQEGVLQLMGECYGLLKRPANAAEQYAGVSDRFPERAGLALEAARWFERAGDNVKALEYARRAQYLGNDEGKALAEALEGK